MVPLVVYNPIASASPQARFESLSGVSMVPRCFPAGEMTQIPPGPLSQTFPRMSIFIPSGAPGRLSGLHVDEQAAVGRRAIRADIVGIDFLRPDIIDVQRSFIR